MALTIDAIASLSDDQFTMSRESYDRLHQAQDLLRHVIPDGDPAEIFERALQLLVSDLERKKLAQVERPRPAVSAAPGSRHIPAGVRREVWTRDGGRCAFVGAWPLHRARLPRVPSRRPVRRRRPHDDR